jgi:hypothetical protein
MSFNAMLTRNPARNLGAMPLGYDRLAFLLVLGSILVGFGVYDFGAQRTNWFFVGLGALFFLYGISQYFTAKRFRDKLRGQKD